MRYSVLKLSVEMSHTNQTAKNHGMSHLDAAVYKDR